MTNCKLILLDGMSTVGKSSTSKSVYRQLALHTSCVWLHEECAHHPIREAEFEAGDTHTLAGMELNRTVMLARWQAWS